jgi:Fur family peroxide stress response transcriptional regulator
MWHLYRLSFRFLSARVGTFRRLPLPLPAQISAQTIRYNEILWYNHYWESILIMKRRETKQREAILRVLRNTRAHPTAGQIYDEVRKNIPHISKGTVYRNLQVLEEEGAITGLHLDGTLSRYETKQEDHYHFRCEKCGRVSDIDVPVDKNLDHEAERRTGLKISSHQLEFRGLCKDCQ